MARISVVVPNWNGQARLARLLDSLDQQTERAWEVLVVDNGSSDQSQQTAHARAATWIPLDRNYGFACAVNTGIKHATGQAIAILNNDVTVAPDYLERLGGALENHAFATPRILMASDPTRLDGTFDLTSRGFCSWRAGHGFPASTAVWNQPRVIASAPMTACLFRRSVFDAVGLLDEQFVSYLEDVDFGIRCALKGIEGYYEPAAVAWHEGSATLGGEWSAASVKWIARNQVLLSRKYDCSATWPVWVGQLLWGLAALKNGTGRAWIQGKLEGYRLRIDAFNDLAITTGRALEREKLKQILRSQEREIQMLLTETSIRQSYWSAYRALTGDSN